jgi:hypothetical protein
MICVISTPAVSTYEATWRRQATSVGRGMRPTWGPVRPKYQWIRHRGSFCEVVH